MDNKLNEKLAKWAGFVRDDVTPCTLARGFKPSPMWIFPDGDFDAVPPDFCNDLNACFKWLAPKLEGVLLQYKPATRGWPAIVYAEATMLDPMHSAWAKAGENEMALALCLAIEKVIGMEATNG